MTHERSQAEGEPLPELNDVFEQGLQNFLAQAKKELREQGLDESAITYFSEIFERRFRTEYGLLAKFKEAPEDLHEHVDDALRLAISDIKDSKLKQAANSLWGLRAEENLERLEAKQKNQGKDNVIKFKQKQDNSSRSLE